MKLKAVVFSVLLVNLSCASMRSHRPNDAELKPRNAPVQVGELAPDFTLEDQRDQKVTLSSVRGKMPTVLVFYRGYW